MEKQGKTTQPALSSLCGLLSSLFLLDTKQTEERQKVDGSRQHQRAPSIRGSEGSTVPFFQRLKPRVRAPDRE